MIKFINDIVVHWHILEVRIWSDIKSTVVGTRFGYIWWVLDPIFMMLIYYYVVHIVLSRGGPDYAYFLLTGLIGWQWFTRSFNLGVAAFTRNSGLIQINPSPLGHYILSPILVHLFFAVIGFFFVTLLIDPMNLLFWPGLIFILITQLLLTFGLCCFFAVLNVFFRDTVKLFDYILRALMFFSPILYAPERVLEAPSIPQWLKILFQLNPFATLIPAYRDVILHASFGINFETLLLSVISIVLVQLGLMFLRNFQNRIIQAL